MTNDEISKLQQRSDEQRLRRHWSMTPEQRMNISAALQRSAWESLQQNPDAMRAFTARNHHQRRASNVEKLLVEMLGHSSNDESS